MTSNEPINFGRVERSCSKAAELSPCIPTLPCCPPAITTKSESWTPGAHVNANIDADVVRGRVVPVRNRSAAQLLAREMEILCNDQIYQDALAVAERMIERSRPPSGQRLPSQIDTRSLC